MNPIQNTILRLLDAVKDSQDFERIILNARLTERDFEALRDLQQEAANNEEHFFTWEARQAEARRKQGGFYE